MQEYTEKNGSLSSLERRCFIRMMGSLALGGAMTSLSARADTQKEVSHKEPSFQCVKVIPLPIRNPVALNNGLHNTIGVVGDDELVLLNLDGKETARYSIGEKPECFCTDSGGRFWLGFQDRIAILDPREATPKTWRQLGNNAWVTSMTGDETNLYVADAGNRIVLRFDMSGTLLAQIGARDSERGIPGLLVPSPYFDVALDPMGALWVVNPGKHGVESYRPDGSLITSWYRPGMELAGFCGCCNPIHIAFRQDCSLVTLEKGLNRVKVLRPDFTVKGMVGELQKTGGGIEELACTEKPAIKDIVVDPNDRIWILNMRKRQIAVYEEGKTGSRNAET